MTDFIKSFSTDQLLPPWRSKGARHWSFVILVSPELIQAHLDLYFNSAGPDLAPYWYEPLDGITFGVLGYTKHGHFTSEHDHQDQRIVSHQELFWSFPVNRWKRTADNLKVGQPDIVWIHPFVFDDNSFVMFSAREIWGTEMGMARMELAGDGETTPLHLDVAIQGVKKFEPTEVSKLLGCMHIGFMDGSHPVDPETVFKDRPHFRLMAQFILQETDEVEINTLKQFRDVFNMHFAVYRALVSSRICRENIANIKVYEGGTINLRFMWSDSMQEINRRLFGLSGPDADAFGHPQGKPGLDADWDMPSKGVPVAFAFSSTSDVSLKVGETLHTYGQF